MSLTPGSAKLNYCGNAINKSLLTPCRRVGLPKKKSTSNSITKLLSHDLNNSNCSILENTPNSSSSENTPNNKSVGIKRKNRNTCNRSVEINSQTSKPKNIESSRVKKNLDQCFEKDAFDMEICKEVVQCEAVNSVSHNKEIECLENQPEISENQNKNSASVRKKSNQITQIENQSNHLKSTKCENIHNNNKNDVKSVFEANNIVKKTVVEDLNMYEQEDSLNIPIKHEIDSIINCSLVQNPPKSNILYQTDDDLKINKSVKNNLKTYERKTSVDKSNYLDTEITNPLKNCSIVLQRFSEDDITISEEKTSKKIDLISSDEEDVFVVKKRKKIELFDDEKDDDFEGFTKKLVKTNKVEKQSKNKDSTKVKRNKIPKVTSFTAGDSFEDEDDAFTSTPDRERNEKYELISKIKVLEKIVNDKKIKLDNLKRAALYKAKHNIEELKSVTDIWRHGCTLGLEGLLKQLQTHGPMDMSTLLKNLQISQEVTSKLFNVI